MNRHDCRSNEIQIGAPIVKTTHEGHVMQPNYWSCLPCAVAMATGTTLQDVIDFVGHDGSERHEASRFPNKERGFFMRDIIPYLAKHNLAMGLWYEPAEAGDLVVPNRLSDLLLANPALLTVNSPLAESLNIEVAHAVYYASMTVWDPMRPWPCELSDYKIQQWWPLINITPLVDPNYDPSKGGGG